MARREELTNEQWSLIEPLFDKADIIQTRGMPRSLKRNILDTALRYKMMRFAKPFSSLLNLPPPFPRIG